MTRILFFFLILLLNGCSKPKTVLICGDHECINKKEAQQYFEENLSIEVKLIDNINKNEEDLLELNLNNESEKKEINIFKKRNTDKKIKKLTKKEINQIKKKIKLKSKKAVKKRDLNNEKENILLREPEIVKKSQVTLNKNNINKVNKFDVCTIIEKCSIDEISKYLIKLGKKRDFPDITSRE